MRETFIAQVETMVEQHGYCVVVASEGTVYGDGALISGSLNKDAFGHHQLGGVAAALASMVKHSLGYKYHYAIADYLQRAARHIASALMWIKPMPWAGLPLKKPYRESAQLW